VKVVMLGATRGMGRALGRELCGQGAQLFLLGRDAHELQRSARDLEARGSGGTVGTAFCDLLDPASFATALDEAERSLGGLDTIVVTAGLFAMQSALESDPELCERVLTADFTRTVQFCEEARRRLLARGGGTLCVFSSVAGDRGRGSVGLYGAAKAGLSCYLEALDHRYCRAGLRVVCVKPGFIRTSMTEGLPTPPFAGEPQAVARRVARAIQRGTPQVYAPAIWQLVMLAVRMLPRAVMRRVQF
jgi:decaprenylphospho-beta-D-erythro-pentofuranosid-2-ulose 2-reductase